MTGAVLAYGLQAVEARVARQVLHHRTLVLDTQLMLAELVHRPQLVTAQELDSRLQHLTQQPVWFGPQVPRLAGGPQNNTRLADIAHSHLVDRMVGKKHNAGTQRKSNGGRCEGKRRVNEKWYLTG
jgi:hypothetical protein